MSKNLTCSSCNNYYHSSRGLHNHTSSDNNNYCILKLHCVQTASSPFLQGVQEEECLPGCEDSYPQRACDYWHSIGSCSSKVTKQVCLRTCICEASKDRDRPKCLFLDFVNFSDQAEATTRFNAWVAANPVVVGTKVGNWRSEVPDCPNKLATCESFFFGTEPCCENDDVWSDPKEANQCYHRGAAYCIRCTHKLHTCAAAKDGHLY